MNEIRWIAPALFVAVIVVVSSCSKPPPLRYQA